MNSASNIIKLKTEKTNYGKELFLYQTSLKKKDVL